MSPLQAAVLGLVQGLTEFLPISSTAHLIVTSRLLGWRDQGLAFDIAVHVGSLIAVLIYFRREFVELSRSALGALGGPPAPGEAEPGRARLAWQLAVATVPVAACGWLAAGLVATAARNVTLVAATSILFGLLLGWADRFAERYRDLGDVGWRAALLVGAAQALALVPGTSRSGVTITAGRALGMSRDLAARFSFLLAVPVGLLVAAKQAVDLVSSGSDGADWVGMGIGFAVSGVSAYLAIDWLLAWLRRQSLAIFVVYRVLLGLAILGLARG